LIWRRAQEKFERDEEIRPTQTQKQRQNSRHKRRSGAPVFLGQKLQFIEWNCLLEGEGRVVEEPGIIECDTLQFGVPVVLVSVDLVPIDLAEAVVKSFLEGYLFDKNTDGELR